MTTRRKPEAGPEPNLPVTPMLDMAFQLLAFFVMTYHPSDLEGQMDLNLASEPVTNRPEEVPPPRGGGVEIELPSKLTVIVRTRQDGINNGRISALTVQDDAGAQPVEDLDALRRHLEKVRETIENQDSIKIQADARLKWDAVVQVMDICHQAHFTNVRFVAPEGQR